MKAINSGTFTVRVLYACAILAVIGLGAKLWGGPYDYTAPGIQNWDATRPPDAGEPPSLGASAIRQVKKCVEEWVDVQHNRDGTHSTNFVTATMIQSGAVTEAKIADGSVTAAKLASALTTNRLHAVSGYDTLPSGLIIQWVTGEYDDDEANETVAFARAFPTACLNVQVTTQIASAENSDNWFQLVSFTTEQCVVRRQFTGSGSRSCRPVIFAIGY